MYVNNMLYVCMLIICCMYVACNVYKDVAANGKGLVSACGLQLYGIMSLVRLTWYVCMYLCMYVCTFVCVCVCIYTHTYMYEFHM